MLATTWETLQVPFAGNPLANWLLALSLAGAVILIAWVAKLVLLRRTARRAPEAERALDWRAVVHELTARTSSLFIVLLGLYAGSLLLDLPPGPVRLVASAFVIVFFIQAALWGDRVVAAVMSWRLNTRTNGGVRNALAIIHFLGRVAVWSLALLLILDNLGFDVTALVAGLGIGGIAVALAAQSVLGDLFASLAIVLDRPFEVGDFIIFDDYLGTVEKIGIKTTRIRALSGEQLVCANSDLLNSRIRNFKRMQERRVVFKIGIVYETPPETLERVAPLLRELVEAQEQVRFDRAHFFSFGDFALVFEVVYWVQSPDFNVYADVQQRLNLDIFRRFQAEGISFAYPTQTLYLPGLEAAGFEPPAGRRRAATARS